MKLPNDQNLERSILGCIIYENSTILDVMDILKPESFYTTSHQVIFEKMTEMYLAKHPIDYATLPNALQGKGIGTHLLSSLADGDVMPSRVKHYAKRLKDIHIKRELIFFQSELHEDIETGKDVTTVLGKMVDKAFSLSSNMEDNIKTIKQVLSKTIKQIEAANQNDGVNGVKTGIDKLDSILCGLKPKLYVIAGRPGYGKTALVLNVAANDSKKSTLVFSLEMPDEEVGIRFLASDGRINTQGLENGDIRESHWTKLMNSCGRLSNANIYIDDSVHQTDFDIFTKAKRHKMKHGLDLVIIDYIQLVKSAKKCESRRLELEEISRNFKMMSKDLGVPVIALAQLSRKCVDERRKPRLSDLREAGGIEQDADVVLMLHHPHSIKETEPEELIEGIFCKHRGGPTGMIKLRFEKEFVRFTDWMINHG
jgi:replicative DNA helicase